MDIIMEKPQVLKILVLKQQTECLKGQLVLRVNLIISMQELHIIIKHT